MAVDGEVGVVLELKLLLLLARDRHLLVGTLGRVQLPSRHLFRLEPFLVPPSARRLTALALPYRVFLVFFDLAAVHVLRCIRCPKRHTIECCYEGTAVWDRGFSRSVRGGLLPRVPVISCLKIGRSVGINEGAYRDLSGPWFMLPRSAAPLT